MFCNVQWAGKFWSHWMNLRLRKGNLLIYMTAVRYHCRRNFKCMTSLNKSAKGETEAGALCWQQISNQAWTRLQLTMVFLIGERKLTTWFETLLTDSQVKKNTVSCVSSEKTGRTLFFNQTRLHMTSIQLQGDLIPMMWCSSTSTEQIFLMRSCYLLLNCFQKMFQVWYPGILLNSVLKLLS